NANAAMAKVSSPRKRTRRAGPGSAPPPSARACHRHPAQPIQAMSTSTGTVTTISTTLSRLLPATGDWSQPRSQPSPTSEYTVVKGTAHMVRLLTAPSSVLNQEKLIAPSQQTRRQVNDARGHQTEPHREPPEERRNVHRKRPLRAQQ